MRGVAISVRGHIHLGSLEILGKWISASGAVGPVCALEHRTGLDAHGVTTRTPIIGVLGS